MFISSSACSHPPLREDLKWSHYDDKGSLIKLVITKLVSLNYYFLRARQLMC